jgi:hypothetical protein
MPSPAELTAATVAERCPKASPLQALVQDIMREQQQQQRQVATALVGLCMNQPWTLSSGAVKLEDL